MTGRPRTARGRAARAAVRAVAGFVLPTVVYYLLRGAGAAVYPALLVAGVVSAGPGAVQVARRRRVDGLSAWASAMTVGALAVSLVPGGTQLLLAKEALLTGVTGVWFLVTARGDRPLSYLFTRPVVQGRFRWPDDWDGLWERSPAFRRMWRVSSVLWGVGLLADAAVRVVMAYRLPPDRVPALALGLYLVISAVLIVVTNGYYVACGVLDPRSPLRTAGLSTAR